ncbi:hypothetical protein [Sphingobium indicum]
MIAAALACLFFGDSTAVGTAAAFNRSARTRCAVQARVGASPAEMSRWAAPTVPIGTAVVAAGSNSPASPSLAADLARLRGHLHARRVIWLLPYDRSAAATVEHVAQSFGDYVLDLAELPSADRLHPHTYTGIATALQRWRIAGE